MRVRVVLDPARRPRGGFVRRLAMVALVGSLAACSAPPPEAVAPAPGGPEEDELAVRQRAALNALYGYAYRAPEGEGAVRVDPVAAAAALARPAASDAAEGLAASRRFRAVSLIYAAATATGPDAKDWRPPEAGEAMRVLLGEHFARFVALTEQGCPLCPRTDDRIQIVEGRRQIAVQALVLLGTASFLPQCQSCLEQYMVIDAVGGEPAKAYFQIRVARPQADVAKILDPQSWSACNKTFFAESYAAKAGACASATPTVRGAPPQPGSAWCGPLFEHFRVDLPALPTCPKNRISFENLLCIQTYVVPSLPSGDFFGFDYRLCPPKGSLASTVSCNAMPGGLQVDCGWAKAQGNAQETVVAGVKYLKYAPRSDPAMDLLLGAWTYNGLRNMIDTIATEGVCCQGGPPFGGCPSPRMLDVMPDSPSCQQSASCENPPCG